MRFERSEDIMKTNKNARKIKSVLAVAFGLCILLAAGVVCDIKSEIVVTAASMSTAMRIWSDPVKRL